MAITVYEMFDSRKVDLQYDSQSAVLEFFLKGTTEEEDARIAFLDYIPTTFVTLVLDNVQTSCIGGDFWRATANYRPIATAIVDGGLGDPGDPPPAQGDPGGVPSYSATDALGPEFAFDISGVQEHITQSWATFIRAKRGGGAAPDNKNAIGVTADGEIAGCDKLSPHFEYSMTVTVGFVTLTYLGTIYNLVGTTNAATFHGFGAGQVLLTGVSGQSKDTNKYSLTFKFAVRPNETDIDICGDGTLVIPLKYGWQYLWVSYKDVVDSGVLFKQPDAAYVEDIYKDGDFSLLKIGV